MRKSINTVDVDAIISGPPRKTSSVPPFASNTKRISNLRDQVSPYTRAHPPFDRPTDTISGGFNDLGYNRYDNRYSNDSNASFPPLVESHSKSERRAS